MENRTYIAIDLKSFYASVECIERGLDPMTTNLVVADASRTEKTICLAVSPSLKSYGIPGRPRLFEVVQRVREVNAQRKRLSPHYELIGSSYDNNKLNSSPELALDYIAAPPRMAYYMKYSTQIYNIYLKYISPEDIHVYSIDEVFMDVTEYLKTYEMTAEELAKKIIRDVLDTTGITATVGIGTNLYLCKIAMDVVAKHIPADKNGAKIASLDEISYRKSLWNHRPLTDFWRVGKGYAKRLEEQGLYTMGDVARCSIGKSDEYYNEELLYRIFGVNAELLIDHAWGYEPCTIADIKAYKPSTNSICSGQVLKEPYTYEKTENVVREMADMIALDLVDKDLVTNQIVLTVGYDIENLTNSHRRENYHGEITTDQYGRQVPKSAHGTANFKYTSSSKAITSAVIELFERIANRDLLVRRLNMSANRIISENDVRYEQEEKQLSFFVDYEKQEAEKQKENAELKKEKDLQKVMLAIKKKFGKNSILKGMNLEDGATAIDRNQQIGGHKA